MAQPDSKDKRKSGAKYHPVFHPQLARWIISYGYTDRQLAEELGVSSTTVRRWKKKHPEFAKAIAQADVSREVEKSLLQSALGSDKLELVEEVTGENTRGPFVRSKHARIKPSLAAQKFWLQHRCPGRWRDKPAEDEPQYDEPEFLS